jgi:hypothetical protein
MGKASRRKRLRVGSQITYHGDGSRSVPLSKKAMEGIEELRQQFIQRWGREPRPEDPLFWDPYENEPKPMGQDSQAQLTRQICEAMRAAGISEDKIYATEKTGLMPTADNIELMEPDAFAEWCAAAAEYRAKELANAK